MPIFMRQSIGALGRRDFDENRVYYRDEYTGRYHFLFSHLTIRLFALDFYEVTVDEGEGRINYHLIDIESE